MSKRYPHPGTLLTLAIASAMATGIAAAEGPSTTFRIMSDEEMAAHRMTMQALSGEAREEYRNAQYAQLRRRALDNGYRMPETPPWQAEASAPADAAAPAQTDSAAQSTAESAASTDAAARHNELREKLQAKRDAMQQAAMAERERVAVAKPAPVTPPAAPLAPEPPAMAAETPAPAAPHPAPPAPVVFVSQALFCRSSAMEIFPAATLLISLLTYCISDQPSEISPPPPLFCVRMLTVESQRRPSAL